MPALFGFLSLEPLARLLLATRASHLGYPAAIMNGFGIFVLIAWVARYGLELAADLLNRSALDRDPDPTIASLYPPETRSKTRAYLGARLRVRIIESTLDLVTLLAFWGLGGFSYLDSFCRELGWGPVGTGLAFIGALVFLQGLLSLPFEIWRTFGIEARFGFNRTTVATFVMDLGKSTVLGILLGAPLLAAVLWFFEVAGSWAWLACWSVTAIFSLAVQWIVPTWILPLFFKFEPLEESQLRQAILSYAESVQFPLRDLFVVDGSRRSSKANAFFTGMGKNRRVALFDTLIEQHEEDELVAVVAHEIGHYRLGHMPKMLIISILHMGLLFGLLGLLLPQAGLYSAFCVENASIYTGLIFFSLLYGPVELLLSLVIQELSRRHEYQADAFAAQTTGATLPLQNGLKRLSVEQLAHPSPHKLWVALHASHPPLADRLRALGP